VAGCHYLNTCHRLTVSSCWVPHWVRHPVRVWGPEILLVICIRGLQTALAAHVIVDCIIKATNFVTLFPCLCLQVLLVIPASALQTVFPAHVKQ
jgi:hypothetical protein